MKKTIIVLAVMLCFASTCFSEDWSFREDKQWHAGIGFLEGLAFQSVGEKIIQEHYPSWSPFKKHCYATAISFGTSTFINLIKEATDQEFSIADIGYATGGWALGSGAAILVWNFDGDGKNWKFQE